MAATYDNSFRPISQSIGGAHVVAFSYDADELLTQAGDATVVHDAINGLLSTVTVGDTQSSLAYNGFGEPETMTYTNSSGLLYEESHVRDAIGRITESVETTGSGSKTWEFGYDVRRAAA